MARETANETAGNQLAWMMGWLNYKGQATDRNGASDRIYMKQRHAFCVEWKRKNGARRKTQKTEQKLCNDHGVPYYFCDSLESFRDVLLLEESKL